MVSIKFRSCCVPAGIALASLAINPGLAISPRSPLIPLNKGETNPLLLAPLLKGGWGDQTQLAQVLPRSPLIPLNKGETNPLLLAPLLKGGWGDQTQLAQSNPPPPPKNPGSSSPGGRRDPSACPQDTDTATSTQELTALSPTTKSGNTLAERPTFFVFVPKTSAKTAEFSLRDRSGKGVYRTTFDLTNVPGIVGFSLPTQAQTLEVGKQYVWSFAVICNPNNRIDDRFVTGTVQRITLDPTRLRQIQQAPPKERVLLYQEADVWYDAIAVLFELQRTQPNDPSINTIWRDFLKSGGVVVTERGEGETRGRGEGL
jgi:hypothetical protein